jgi:hypothetical protein
LGAKRGARCATVVDEVDAAEAEIERADDFIAIFEGFDMAEAW